MDDITSLLYAYSYLLTNAKVYTSSNGTTTTAATTTSSTSISHGQPIPPPLLMKLRLLLSQRQLQPGGMNSVIRIRPLPVKKASDSSSYQSVPKCKWTVMGEVPEQSTDLLMEPCFGAWLSSSSSKDGDGEVVKGQTEREEGAPICSFFHHRMLPKAELATELETLNTKKPQKSSQSNSEEGGKSQHHVFSFADGIFGPNDTNDTVYQRFTEHLVDEVMNEGKRVAQVTYGQTGSGKTHTTTATFALALRGMLAQLEREGKEGNGSSPPRRLAISVIFLLDDCTLVDGLETTGAGGVHAKSRLMMRLERNSGLLDFQYRDDSSSASSSPPAVGSSGGEKSRDANWVEVSTEEEGVKLVQRARDAVCGTSSSAMACRYATFIWIDVVGGDESQYRRHHHPLQQPLPPPSPPKEEGDTTTTSSHWAVPATYLHRSNRPSLLFVDNFGSERPHRGYSVKGDMFVERVASGKELAALGECLVGFHKLRQSMADGEPKQNWKFVPWRNAQLTRILQPYIQTGECHLVFTVASWDEAESVATLKTGGFMTKLSRYAPPPDTEKKNE